MGGLQQIWLEEFFRTVLVQRLQRQLEQLDRTVFVADLIVVASHLRKKRERGEIAYTRHESSTSGPSQPRVNLAAVLIGGCSPFVCRDGDDLNSTVLVSLLKLYQVAHRPLTRFTRGSTKSEDVQFARLEA